MNDIVLFPCITPSLDSPLDTHCLLLIESFLFLLQQLYVRKINPFVEYCLALKTIK